MERLRPRWIHVGSPSNARWSPVAPLRDLKKKECAKMLYFSKGRAFQERNFFVLRERERERERERLPQAWLGQGNWGSSLGRSEIFHVFFIYSLDKNFDAEAKNTFSNTVKSWLSLYKAHSSLPAIRVVSDIPIQNVQKTRIPIPIGARPPSAKPHSSKPSLPWEKPSAARSLTNLFQSLWQHRNKARKKRQLVRNCAQFDLFEI